jgi:HK97 family phage major capsid protein
MNLVLRKKEIEDRLTEIRSMVEKEEDMKKLEEMEKETDKLQEERSMIEKKMSLTKMTEIPMISTKNNAEQRDLLEKRGKDLMENRTIKVSSDEVLLPEHVDSTLAPYPFKPVSELVDRVHTINLQGGETYTKSYVKSYGEAGTTEEGASYTETEPHYGYVTIPKVKVTAYTEITEELEKLPAINYQAEVIKNINISLRKKISQQIIKGDGTTNNFTGIFSDKADALKDQADLEISAIDENTLDDIVFAYGGDEAIENGACLIINKNDLRAFAKLRTKEGRKVHNIDYVNQTIDGIPYVLNGNCSALSDPSTGVGTYCIAYGSLFNYEVPIFSNVEIGKSTDYKFKDGIICYKASVFTGGNVVGYKGFVRVKKGEATPVSEPTE